MTNTATINLHDVDLLADVSEAHRAGDHSEVRKPDDCVSCLLANEADAHVATGADCYEGIPFPSGSKEWYRMANHRYAAAAREAMYNNPDGWRHAGCDHAYGICSG